MFPEANIEVEGKQNSLFPTRHGLVECEIFTTNNKTISYIAGVFPATARPFIG